MVVKEIKRWHRKRETRNLICGIFRAIEKDRLFDDSQAVAIHLWSLGLNTSEAEPAIKAWRTAWSAKSDLALQCAVAMEAINDSPCFTEVEQNLKNALLAYTAALRHFFDSIHHQPSRN